MSRTILSESHKHLFRGVPVLWARPRVLFAGDKTPTMSLASRVLWEAGYDVRLVRLNDRVADSLRRKSGLASQAIELAVVDATSKPSVAFALLDTLRSVGVDLPVIVIADSTASAREEAHRLGAEAVLESPLDVSKLRCLVETLVPPVPDLAVDMDRRGLFRH